MYFSVRPPRSAVVRRVRSLATSPGLAAAKQAWKRLDEVAQITPTQEIAVDVRAAPLIPVRLTVATVRFDRELRRTGFAWNDSTRQKFHVAFRTCWRGSPHRASVQQR